MEDHKPIMPDYDLLAKYFAGQASIDQTIEIENWVSENPRHKRTFDSMYYLWVQSGRKKIEEQINVSDSWAKMKLRMKNEYEIKPLIVTKPKQFRLTAVRVLQLAAVIIIGLVIGVLIKYLNPNPKLLFQETEFAMVDLKLPDSSQIKLNIKSKISYPEKFKGSQRLVKLEGEAFFEVKPDKEKPFIIETAFSKIKVVGTSFSVQAYDTSDIVEVTVVSGVVELSGKEEGGEKVILKKGEKGKIDKNSGKPFKETKAADNELFWATRTLIFKDTELYVATETISRAYNVEIELLNEEIKYCKLNVVFPDETIEEIMRVLQITFNLRIEKFDNHYKLYGTQCN